MFIRCYNKTINFTNIFLFFLFSPSLVYSVFSQEIKIQGTVQNELKEPVPNILISILSDNKIAFANQYSNKEGVFSFILSDDIGTPLYIKASSFFYADQEIKIDLTKRVVFILKPEINQLDEVVITSSSKFNNDTINLGINKYNIKKTESIEKLLRKIPGISVNKDGVIKYWNKEIEKILIDGDDLANDRYTFISKNLRSEVLEDIQVLKNFEENTVFKKNRKSKKIALNLKIKEQFKNIWFGNASMGYGNGLNSGTKFKESLSLGLLKKKIKFLDSQKFSSLGDKSIPDFFSEKEDNEKNNNPIYSIKKIDVLLPDEVSSFNDAFSDTFLINKKINNLVIRSTNFIGIDNQKQESSTKTDFFFQEDNLVLEKNDTSDKKTLFFGEIELKHVGLKNSFFINKFKYKMEYDLFSSSSIFDINKNSDSNKSKKLSFYEYFQYTYDFNNGIILNNEMTFGLSKLNENAAINSESLSSVIQINSPINQNAEKYLRNFGIKTDFTYLLNRKLKSTLLLNFKNNEERFDISLIPVNTTYRNNAVFKRNEFIVNPFLIYNLSRKVKFKAGLSSNFFSLNEIKKTLLNYNAILNLRFWGNLEFSFSQKQKFPTNQNFLQNRYLINNNTFRKGGLFFESLNYEQLKVRLENMNRKNTHNNEFSFTYKKTKSFLLNEYYNEDNINYNNTFFIHRKGEEYKFKNQFIFLVNSLGFKIETSQLYLLIPLNNQKIELNKIYNGLYNFDVTSYFSSPINFNLKFEYNKSTQKSKGNTSSFDSKNMILELDWNINKEISFNINGGVYELNQNIYNIFNTSINYIPNNTNFSYTLRINNLFNENEFSFQHRNSFFNSETTIPIIPFYAFASVKYIF